MTAPFDASKFLIEQGPVGWSKPLEQYYNEREKQLNLSLKQWEAHRKERVKVAGEESLIRLAGAFAKAGSSLAQGAAALKKANALDEVKEKNKHINLLNNLYRGGGSTEATHKYHTLVAEYEKGGQNILDNQVEHNKILLQAYPKPELIVDGVLQIDSKTGQPIIDKKAFDKFAEIRNAYQKLSPAELLITREYDGIKFSQTLHGKAFDAYLAREGLSKTYANASDPDKANMMQSWQVDELAPYGFSDGMVGSTILKELNRASDSRQGVNRAFQSTAFTSEAAANFKEKGKVFSTQGGVDGEGRGNFARFVSYEIVKGSLDFEDDPTGTLNGKTAMQKSKDRVVSWLSELAITENVNIPELLGSNISELPGGNTLQQAFFDKKGENYKQLMTAWNTGLKYRAAEADAQTNNDLAIALQKAKTGELSDVNRDLAANTYLSRGGDPNNTYYKQLIGINLKPQSQDTVELEQTNANNALLSGRLSQIEGVINNTNNNGIKTSTQQDYEAYKNLRQVVNEEKGDNSDDQAKNLLNERNELNLGPEDKIPPRMEVAHSLISQLRDRIWFDEYLTAKQNNTLNDKTISARVDLRLEEKLQQLGFRENMETGGARRGILTPDSSGNYPALMVQRKAERELNTGSDHGFTFNRLWNNWQESGAKTKGEFLNQKGSALQTEELVALAKHNWNEDTNKVTWPKDILIVSELLGVPPSEVVRSQLEALIASPNKEDKFIVDSFKLKNLLDNLPTHDLKVLEFLESKGDPTIVAKYKALGLHGMDPKLWNQMIALEKAFNNFGAPRQLTEGELTAAKEALQLRKAQSNAFNEGNEPIVEPTLNLEDIPEIEFDNQEGSQNLEFNTEPIMPSTVPDLGQNDPGRRGSDLYPDGVPKAKYTDDQGRRINHKGELLTSTNYQEFLDWFNTQPK